MKRAIALLAVLLFPFGVLQAQHKGRLCAVCRRRHDPDAGLHQYACAAELALPVLPGG